MRGGISSNTWTNNNEFVVALILALLLSFVLAEI